MNDHIQGAKSEMWSEDFQITINEFRNTIEALLAATNNSLTAMRMRGISVGIIPTFQSDGSISELELGEVWPLGYFPAEQRGDTDGTE